MKCHTHMQTKSFPFKIHQILQGFQPFDVFGKTAFENNINSTSKLNKKC